MTPKRTMAMLTMEANTGRRMDRSDRIIGLLLRALRRARQRVSASCDRLTYPLDPTKAAPVMALKLSARQLSQLAYLETLPPKFARVHTVIEQMASMQVDDSVVRGLGRVLDDIKSQSQAMGLGGLADTAGYMGT